VCVERTAVRKQGGVRPITNKDSTEKKRGMTGVTLIEEKLKLWTS
jgi:hypothetical protein